MQVYTSTNLAKLKGQIALTQMKLIRASLRAYDRMGLYIEARAVQFATVNTGYRRQHIHKEDAEYDRSRHTVSVRVVDSSGYGLYLEMGFQGHFVPFHVADGLYWQALRSWGWRVPAPGTVNNPDPRKRYLTPRGRKTPVWGVFVRGDAKPALRPALEEFRQSGLETKILEEEFRKELATK